MKRYLYIALSSLLAGFFIAIGAVVYLSILSGGNNDYLAKIMGSLFFAIGLFSIIQLGTWLYTGKVGFVLDNKPKYFIDLLVCIVFNLVGVILLSLVIKATRISASISPLALKLVEAKQNDSWYSILILSFMCGIMIYLAVKGHQVCPYSIGKITFVFLSVSVFILCSFEHVIANAAYYTLAGYFDLKTVLYFVIMAIGNGLGSIAIDGLLKLMEKFKTN